MLWGLFLSAFLAATILPAQSELALGTMLKLALEPAWLLIAIATLGNVLGAVVNWALGFYGSRFREHKYFPVKPADLAKAEKWYRRWGHWSLLLSWAPIIGDPLTLVAGLLRQPLPSFLLLVTIAKLGRYLAVAFIVYYVIP